MSDTAGEDAAKRADQVAARHDDLVANRPVTPSDIARSRQRAEQSRRRAQQAHVSAGERHLEAADIHERAALVHDQAVSDGMGDPDAHHTDADDVRIVGAYVGDHRRAAEQDRNGARVDERRADDE
jgi:hypothetical protein